MPVFGFGQNNLFPLIGGDYNSPFSRVNRWLYSKTHSGCYCCWGFPCLPKRSPIFVVGKPRDILFQLCTRKTMTRKLEQDSVRALTVCKLASQTDQRPVSRKSRKLFGPEKPFAKLRPAYSVKLVFSYVAKGIKIKITAKFRASRHLRIEDTKRIISPEMPPKSFGTFEKRVPVHKCNASGELHVS